jgi:hypothetical protein
VAIDDLAEQLPLTAMGLSMLNKEQAVAALDALILKAETERNSRLERRTARLVFFYPVLRRAPAEEREALVRAARAAPLSLGVISVVALLAVLAIAWALFGGPDLGADPPARPRHLLAILAAFVLAAAPYLCIRAFLQREVPRRYPKHPA